MSGIINNTARQFNLKRITTSGRRVVVRIAPGFNVVDDKHWESFVSKEGKILDPYVEELKKDGSLDFGSEVDDKELELDPDTQAKSKSEPLAAIKAEANKARIDAEMSKDAADKARAEADKARAEADKARAEAEAAKIELSKLKGELTQFDLEDLETLENSKEVKVETSKPKSGELKPKPLKKQSV